VREHARGGLKLLLPTPRVLSAPPPLGWLSHTPLAVSAATQMEEAATSEAARAARPTPRPPPPSTDAHRGGWPKVGSRPRWAAEALPPFSPIILARSPHSPPPNYSALGDVMEEMAPLLQCDDLQRSPDLAPLLSPEEESSSVASSVASVASSSPVESPLAEFDELPDVDSTSTEEG
jgi:hypothetical protein